MGLGRRILAVTVSVLGVVVVVTLVVTTATVAITVRRPHPQYAGEIRVPGLDGPVQVRRDARGIPHIEATTTADLFFAQGYVTAQDRFFEMDVRRHITAGRLSELVGEDEDALAADRVVRTLGWRRVAEAEVRRLPAPEREILDAYSAGVNAYLAGRSPGEISVAYPILGLQVPLPRIERWNPTDSLAWLKAIAWNLSSNPREEATRALLLAEGLSSERVAQLYPPYPERRPTIVEGVPDGVRAEDLVVPEPSPTGAGDDSAAALALDAPGARPALESAVRALEAVPALAGAPTGTGSNSWAVAGKHTASGGPLLSNDPHLEPSVPSVWYQVGLRCAPVGPECPFDVSGFSFAGLPGVIVGRNARIAWGLTATYVDDSDYVLERVVDDTRYLVDGRRLPLQVRTETITVAGAEPVELRIRETRHGPLVSGVLDEATDVGRQAGVPPGSPPRGAAYDVALSWTALEPGTTFEALVAVNTAGDWESFRAAAARMSAPSQNLLYADVDGHIGYQTAGLVPVRGAGDGQVPAPGWDSAYDWTGWLPFERLPSVLDPDEGVLVTANNKITRDPAAPYLGTETAAGFRATAVTAALDELVPAGDVAPQDMAALQVSEVSPLRRALVPYLLEVEGVDEFTAEAVDLLREWDGRATGDSAAMAYAAAVWAALLDLTYDEIPDGLRPTGTDRDLVAMSALLEAPADPWWDDAGTPGVVEGRDDVLARALTEARLDLTRSLAKDPVDWRWDRLHVLRTRQLPLGAPSVPWPVRRLVNLADQGVSGGTDSINATAWDASTGSFEVTAVPTMRMVVDLGDPDGGSWVIATGASGHPAHGHYGDQAGAWRSGETFDWPVTPGAVEAATERRLELVPP